MLFQELSESVEDSGGGNLVQLEVGTRPVEADAEEVDPVVFKMVVCLVAAHTEFYVPFELTVQTELAYPWDLIPDVLQDLELVLIQS
jgi:hypothetical protein